ncbi:MAG: hypothetical protein SGPRY_012780 [Prymnesium sp.]
MSEARRAEPRPPPTDTQRQGEPARPALLSPPAPNAHYGARNSALTSGMLELPRGASRGGEGRRREPALTAESSSVELLCSRRVIALIDLDCFYAQCEELRQPSLRGAPLGVQQKMLVITSNYAARAYGIGKGDSVAQVREKCPHITIRSGEDLTWYREVSQRVLDFIMGWSERVSAVERVGMDEMLVDLSEEVDHRLSLASRHSPPPQGYLYPNSLPLSPEDAVPLESFKEGEEGGERWEEGGERGEQGEGRKEVRGRWWEHSRADAHLARACVQCAARLAVGSQVCHELRTSLHTSLGLTTSAGISVSKLLAKLVASAHKPHKQTLFLPTRAALAELLPPTLPISKLPGIGFSLTRRCSELGVTTVGEFLVATEDGARGGGGSEGCLAAALAGSLDQKTIASMRELCLARCEAEVQRSGAPKSISAEESFWQQPLCTVGLLEANALSICTQIMRKLRCDERHFGCRQPSTLAVSLRFRGEAGAALMPRRQSKQERLPLALRLGRAPPPIEGTAGSRLEQVDLSAADLSLVQQLGRRAIALFKAMLPDAAADPFAPVHIFNVALRFDAPSQPPPRNSLIKSFFEGPKHEAASMSGSSQRTAGSVRNDPESVLSSAMIPEMGRSSDDRSEVRANASSRQACQLDNSWHVHARDIDPEVLSELPTWLREELQRDTRMAAESGPAVQTVMVKKSTSSSKVVGKRAKLQHHDQKQGTLACFLQGRDP